MSDLISRQDAMALVDRPIVPTGDADYDNAREAERESIKEDLSLLPSAEPKIGTWVLKQDWEYCCSCCGEESGLDETDVFVYGMKLPNYCPVCGAKMQRVDHDQVTADIESLPSAPDSRQRGEWIEAEVLPEVYDIEGVKTWGSKMQCDQCGFMFTAVEGHISQYNYCPMCGARMNGGEEE